MLTRFIVSSRCGMLDVCLLGCGGMMPLPERFLTSLLCRHKGRMFLIDCGEATQITMKINGWGFKKIDVLCFTHYHADHISGLPGLLLTIGNSGRTEPLNLVGPTGLKEVVSGLLVIAKELPFKLVFHEIEEECGTINFGEINIDYFKVKHKIECYGYNIVLDRVGKFNVEKAVKNKVPKQIWGSLQRTKEYVLDGVVYRQEQVLDDRRKGLKVTYVTDSLPCSAIAKNAENSDLFICEGMYGDEEQRTRTHEKFHMIFADAISLAKQAKVGEMWLTHFSPALDEPFEYEEYLKSSFENGEIGFDRKQKTFYFEN